MEPGKYAKHLENWLQFYPSSQLVIIDGEKLKTDPVGVMNKFQRDIKMTPFIDYKDNFVYDENKGFYCMKDRGKNYNKVTCKNTAKIVGLPFSISTRFVFLRSWSGLRSTSSHQFRLGGLIPKSFINLRGPV